MMMSQTLCNYRPIPYSTFFSFDRSCNNLTLRIGKDFGSQPNSCPFLLQYPLINSIQPNLNTSSNVKLTTPWADISPGGHLAELEILFHTDLKSILPVFRVKRKFKACQLQYNHSTVKESEAREDKAIVLSMGRMPTPEAKMNKSTLSYT